MVDSATPHENAPDRKTATEKKASSASTKTQPQKNKKKQNAKAPPRKKSDDAPTVSRELPSPPITEPGAVSNQGIDDRDDRLAQLERVLLEREHELRRQMRIVSELEEVLQDIKKRYLIGMVESQQDVEILIRDIQTPPDTDILAWIEGRLETLAIRLTQRVEEEIEDLEFTEMVVIIGDRFDPHLHTALPENESETPDSSRIPVIEQVVRKGYLYNGKVALYPIVKIGRKLIGSEDA